MNTQVNERRNHQSTISKRLVEQKTWNIPRSIQGTSKRWPPAAVASFGGGRHYKAHSPPSPFMVFSATSFNSVTYPTTSLCVGDTNDQQLDHQCNHLIIGFGVLSTTLVLVCSLVSTSYLRKCQWMTQDIGMLNIIFLLHIKM